MGRPPGSSSLSRSTADRIRKGLLEDSAPAGTTLPSLRQLAATHAVGLKTVRLALKLLREEGVVFPTSTGKYIMRAPVAQVDTAQEAIVIVTSQPLAKLLTDSTWSGPILTGMLLEAGATAHPLTILHSLRYARFLPADLQLRPLKAVLLFGHFVSRVLQQYRRFRMPTVLVDQPSPFRGLSFVALDNQSAAFETTSRLIRMGHQRIAFLRHVIISVGRIEPDSVERQLGFQQAVEQFGIAKRCTVFTRTFGTQDRTINTILRARPPYTAVLCADSFAAAEVLTAAQAKKLNVPRDLSISCFYGAGESVAWNGPRVEFQQVGREAVRLALVGGSQQVRIAVPYVEGETAAPPEE